jgi:hypothetical protein
VVPNDGFGQLDVALLEQAIAAARLNAITQVLTQSGVANSATESGRIARNHGVIAGRFHAVTWRAPNAYAVRRSVGRLENWESFVAVRIGLRAAVRQALNLGLDRAQGTARADVRVVAAVSSP